MNRPSIKLASGANISYAKTGFWVFSFLLVLIWSAINPADRLTWWLEAIPAIAGFVLVVTTCGRFPLTTMLYWVILLHSWVLLIGAHYTYAEVPLFHTISDWLDYERNHYDKLGHFFQGVTPTLLAREVLIRKSVLQRGGWLALFCFSIALAFSAFYEILEWWVAALSGTQAEAFLGTQGYVWDTQSDMLLAALGAIISLLCLSRRHDRQLARFIE